MSAFNTLRQRLANWLVPPQQAVVPARRPVNLARMYAAAKASRLTEGWGTTTTSEDSEASSSLRTLRNRSRALIRDAAYAKRAKVIVQNNVIGSGIGMQARIKTTRNELNDRLNDAIERAWDKWGCAEYCHTGGALAFQDLERLAMGQIFDTGEIFIRQHFSKFGRSDVPYALEVIEPERIADEFQPSPVEQMTKVRLGIEVDAFHRPVAYWIRTLHPGEIRLTAEQTSRVERVPADDILHLRLVDRWPQTRGVPWLHASARRLNDMDGLGEAEIVAARGAACYMGFIESPDGQSQYGDEQEDGSSQVELQPAMVEKLAPGEKFNFAAPNRPNAQLDPFMRMMLREVAAGVGVSYESLSKDYSQSNYSSSRLALLDDRDLWRVVQGWFIRNFRQIVHKRWLQQAILSGAIPEINRGEYAANPERFEAVRFKPRGWSWIDPTKEVDASKEAVRCGFTTLSTVIANTADGRDFEDVMKERQEELEVMDKMKLKFESDPVADAEIQAEAKAEAQPQPKEPTDPAVATAEKMLRETRNHD